ncbi:LPXTG cell wall anchor domain-containing protein, partial [Bacillus cereus]|nr:LPXTG cell wall anchor domain-containing protein [Bacillus cereus]
TIAPNGYVVNEETFSFEIKENGEIIKHTVKNRKEEKPSTTPKPDQPQTPSVEVKPSIDDVKAIEKPAKDEVRLPMTGGTKEFALLFILGIGFIITGAYVLRLKNRKEM